MRESAFLKEVEKEVESIKLNSTLKERGRLNFEDFNHESATHCIYGQMTGSCTSERAIELCNKSFDSICDYGFIFSALIFNTQTFSKGNSYTALEKYLFMIEDNQRENIIKYIKGEINSIEYFIP